MDLSKLFEMQKVLDDRIIAEHHLEGQNLLPNKILALQVELGECANEWRGFKHWSNDQKPRTSVFIETAPGEEMVHKNPLLEEYVDCLHFILSIGLDLKVEHDIEIRAHFKIRKNIIEQFNEVFLSIGDLLVNIRSENKIASNDQFYDLFLNFIFLGEMLGFGWVQIKEAYYSKNKINHQRQDNHY